jgi:hypothetical protein
MQFPNPLRALPLFGLCLVTSPLPAEDLPPWSPALAFTDPAAAGSVAAPQAPAPMEAAPPDGELAAPAKEKSPVEGWRLEITPFLLAAGMHGNVGVGPISTDVDLEFEEIFDHLNLGAMAHVAAGYDRFGLIIDTIYMNLEDESKQGPAEIDWRLEQFVLNFAATFRLGPFDFLERREGEKEGTWRLRLLPELQAGGRYVYLKTRINPELLNGESVSKDWIDPVIGASIILELTRRFAIIVRGDIGGFGAASDLTWIAAGSVRFRVAQQFAIDAGYIAIDYDFDDGDFSYNVMSRGPALGLTFDF